MWKLCGVFVLALVGSAAAAPDFSKVAGNKGCAAIPAEYDDLVKDCEAQTRAVERACKKAKPCDRMQTDTKPPLEAIDKDHKETNKLEDKRGQLLVQKRKDEDKNDNMPAVQSDMKQISDVDRKESDLVQDVGAQEEKLGAVFDDHIAAWRDCFSAREDLVDVYVHVEDHAAQDIVNESDDKEARKLVGQMDAVFPAWQAAIADTLVKPELVAQAQTCQEDRNHIADFISGNTIAYRGCIGAGVFKDAPLGWTSLGKARAWCNYQNAKSFPNPSDDPNTPAYKKWEQHYEKLKANSSHGSAFEYEALKWLRKRTDVPKSMMLVETESKHSCTDKIKKLGDFIPDWSSDSSEFLTWGQPYEFVEVKDRKEMGLSENLGLMIEYVQECGGHLTVVFRGQVEMEGPQQPPYNETVLSSDLKAALLKLGDKATVLYFRRDVAWPPAP